MKAVLRSLKTRWMLAATLALAAGGCVAQEEDNAVCDDTLPSTNGLRIRVRYHQPVSFTGQSAGHLNELTVLDDALFIANGQDAFSTLQLPAGGALTSVATVPAGLAPPSWQICTTMAVHRASRTVFCGYAQAFEPAIVAFDVSDPQGPRLRDAAALRDPRLTPRRLLVVGDTLYLASFQAGLLAATISPTGGLSALRETGVAGDLRFVDGDERRLVALDHALGLRVLRPDGARWSVGGTLALSGPKLGLRVVGEQALVALGSEGAALVDLRGDAPREALRLRPPGVVTSVDRMGALVAVTCTSGVFLYDVGRARPLLRGWSPARSIMLDGRFHHGDLVVTDWEDVVQFSVNAMGVADLVEVGWGQLVNAGKLPVGLRNPGDVARAVELRTEAGTMLQRVALAPGEARVVELDPAALSFERPPNASATVIVRSPASATAACTRQAVRFVRRVGSEPVAPPGVGDAMPPLVVALSATESLRLPLPGQRTRVVFYSHDCAAVWPQVEDLNYLATVNRLPLDAMPVLLAQENPARFGFTRRFALGNLIAAYYGGRFDPVPDAVRASLAPYGEDLYYSTFQIRDLRGGAAHPNDYVVAPDGRVTRIERLYRGAYTLP